MAPAADAIEPPDTKEAVALGRDEQASLGHVDAGRLGHHPVGIFQRPGIRHIVAAS